MIAASQRREGMALRIDKQVYKVLEAELASNRAPSSTFGFLFGKPNKPAKCPANPRLRGKIATTQMKGAEKHTSEVKRRYPRYEIDTELHVTVLGLEQRRMMRGRSLNISEAGMAGVFVTVGGIGVAVHLEFSLPVTGSPVRVEGIVRSQSGYRYGFEFVELNSVQREIISKTCRTLALLE